MWSINPLYVKLKLAALPAPSRPQPSVLRPGPSPKRGVRVPLNFPLNDHISADDYSLQYHTIDDATSILANLALMAKANLQNAFRLCPVHPLDWPLLGMKWRNQFFIVPFGLRSSP